MPFWTVPPIPGFSLFLFAACVIIFILGMCAFIAERRKEIKKEQERQKQSKQWA